MSVKETTPVMRMQTAQTPLDHMYAIVSLDIILIWFTSEQFICMLIAKLSNCKENSEIIIEVIANSYDSLLETEMLMFLANILLIFFYF